MLLSDIRYLATDRGGIVKVMIHMHLSRPKRILTLIALSVAISTVHPQVYGQALPSTQGTTTHQSEIQSREQKINSIDKELRLQTERLNRNRLDMRDFVITYNALRNYSQRKEAAIALQEKPEMAAYLALQRQPFAKDEIWTKTAFDALSSDKNKYQTWKPITIAGGKFQIRTPAELREINTQLRNKMSRIIDDSNKLEKSTGELKKEKERLIREIKALTGGADVALTDQIILGVWRLTTENNNSTIEFIKNKNNNTYVAVLRENRLNYYKSNATIFVVTPPPKADYTQIFKGKEYGFTDDGLPLISNVSVTVAGRKMVSIAGDEVLDWERVVPKRTLLQK